MKPFSPHSGHHHTIRSVSGSKSVSIIPRHGLPPGRQRHLTPCSSQFSDRKPVASATIIPMYSASRCAGPGIDAIAPSSVNQCVMSTTKVFALRLGLLLFDATVISEPLERPNVQLNQRAACGASALKRQLDAADLSVIRSKHCPSFDCMPGKAAASYQR